MRPPVSTIKPNPIKIKFRWTLVLFLTPVLLWLGLLIVLPHIDLLIMSLRSRVNWTESHWGLGNYIYFFHRAAVLVYLCAHSDLRAFNHVHYPVHRPARGLLYH